MHQPPRRSPAARFAAAMAGSWALLIACAALSAERYEVRADDLVLRGNLVASHELDPATARRHDIPVGANRAVLNVVLSRAGDGRNVPAVVSASSRGPGGERQKILVREVHRGTEPSYLGSFEFKPGQALEFVVEARPAGKPEGQLLSLNFRERMPPE